MNRITKVELTNLCLIYDNDQILVQEKTGTKYKGGLVFPGGHIEDGESLFESVIREVKEETGLTIYNPRPCGFKNWCKEDGTRYLVLLYKTNQFEGELKSSSEGKVFWLKNSEVDSANFIWNMRELLDIFNGNSYSELFFRNVNGSYTEELLG